MIAIPTLLHFAPPLPYISPISKQHLAPLCLWAASRRRPFTQSAMQARGSRGGTGLSAAFRAYRHTNRYAQPDSDTIQLHSPPALFSVPATLLRAHSSWSTPRIMRDGRQHSSPPSAFMKCPRPGPIPILRNRLLISQYFVSHRETIYPLHPRYQGFNQGIASYTQHYRASLRHPQMSCRHWGQPIGSNQTQEL